MLLFEFFIYTHKYLVDISARLPQRQQRCYHNRIRYPNLHYYIHDTPNHNHNRRVGHIHIFLDVLTPGMFLKLTERANRTLAFSFRIATTSTSTSSHLRSSLTLFFLGSLSHLHPLHIAWLYISYRRYRWGDY